MGAEKGTEFAGYSQVRAVRSGAGSCIYVQGMGLTSWSFLTVLILLCIGLPVVAVIGWVRLRPRLLAVLTCVGLLVLSELAAGALVAAVVNRQGHFVATWSQMLSSGSPTAGTGAAVSKDVSIGVGPGGGGVWKASADSSFSTPGQRSTKGRLDAVTMRGPNSGLTSKALVYLPPQYFQRAYRHHTFPAIEAFTGFPGTLSNLTHGLNYPKAMQQLVASHKAHPMIVVMMRPSVNYPRDTECTDVPSGPLAETFFAQDVPDQASQHYRTGKAGWGAIGDSTGGYCAAKIAMMYPTTFPAAVSLSGYCETLRDHTTHDLWGGSTVVRNLNDLCWRLKHRPAPAVSLLVTASKDESGKFGYKDAKNFIKLAKPPLAIDSIITPHGGHNLVAWSALLPPSLSWLSAKLLITGVPK